MRYIYIVIVVGLLFLGCSEKKLTPISPQKVETKSDKFMGKRLENPWAYTRMCQISILRRKKGIATQDDNATIKYFCDKKIECENAKRSRYVVDIEFYEAVCHDDK